MAAKTNHAFEQEYKSFVVPYAPPKGDKRRIIVPETKIARIKQLAMEIAVEKGKERQHQVDGRGAFRRQFTGLLGEAALEEYFGIELIDYSVGNSSKYRAASLQRVGLNVGITTVENWKFPIIYKNPYHPELICVKRKDNEVVLFGYASVDVLKQYQSDAFILDERLRQRGTKSAFYGFSELLNVESLEDLRRFSGLV